MGLGTKTYWLTDRQSQCNFDSIPNSSVPNEESSRQTAMDWRVIRRRDLFVIFEVWESVIKSQYVNQLLINSIIRVKTRLINGMYHHTRHNIKNIEKYT
jgi:hypothetical protein